MPINRRNYPVHTLDCLTILLACGMLSFPLSFAAVELGMKPVATGALSWSWDIFELGLKLLGVPQIQIVCAWCVLMSPVALMLGIRNICGRND
jgi:hypothetical protein